MDDHVQSKGIISCRNRCHARHEIVHGVSRAQFALCRPKTFVVGYKTRDNVDEDEKNDHFHFFGN